MQETEDGQKEELYLHPAFKVSEAELEPLLNEAQRIEEIIETDGYMPGLLVRYPSQLLVPYSLFHCISVESKGMLPAFEIYAKHALENC